MKIAGIIAEYNPFHTGHAYHIQKTCEKCGADHIICVMSGNFTQRGEPAVWDKWTRARSALLGGASLVLELPFAYATQSAEGFAEGGISILDALNCVEYLSFGVENTDLDSMERAAHLLCAEPPEFRNILRQNLGRGLSFPSARAHALSHLLPEADAVVWRQPNNILAIEYLKAMHRQKSKLQPIPVERIGSGYSENALAPSYSSARAIRGAIKDGNDIYKNYLPDSISCSRSTPVFPESMFPFLMFQLRRMTVQEIGTIYGVCEGLEHRIFSAAKKAQNYNDLVFRIASKRYPHSRIQRILLHSLFGITKEQMRKLKLLPLYARVLGIRQDSIDLLSYLSAHAKIPIVTRAAEFPDSLLFDADLLATDIYSLFIKKIAPSKRDFTQKLIVI